ncbi:hypothetical protein [Sulfurisoma sediminicola]|uniref:Uncharacterized protein n=1 Tax=Sulfurisoma sediminicola TaxID=1381557 RepID=A0A497XR99_9PROT|nr:hypothetical protein [Sulfurisoma sediminicola]RLJ68599.1 hypothetical protein DFR35_1167 [Sulfurisoma sediminicola]
MAKRLAFLVVAFALLVAGIESLKVLVAWWQAGRPPPGMAEILACAALALVGFAWWRHSVFACDKGACLLPEKDASDRSEPR